MTDTADKSEESSIDFHADLDEGLDQVVRVRDLFKSFRRGDGTTVPAVDGVSLEVAPGELLVLLGPSGCGKTTLLRCLGGLDTPDSGEIEIHGGVVFSSEDRVNVPPNKRRLSMVFQSYALWPQMTALQIVAYPLTCRRIRKKQAQQQAREALRLVGTAELEGQYPGAMSGGQQQRIALARAIVTQDGLVLFDEPLSNVDAKVRGELRAELVAMQQTVGFAAVYVTHDQAEAMELADRIAVLRDGKIEQLGAPEEIYERPATRYVANFIGSNNELLASVTSRTDDTLRLSTDIGEFTSTRPASFGVGDSVYLSFRPEHCRITLDEPAGPDRWQCLVERTVYLGTHREYDVSVGGVKVKAQSDEPGGIEAGTKAWFSVSPGHVTVLPDDGASAA